MRLVILALLVAQTLFGQASALLMANVSGGGIAVGTTNQCAGGANSAVIGPITTTGNFAIVSVSVATTITASVADTNGNTYTPLTRQVQGPDGQMFYSKNYASGSNTVTVTASGVGFVGACLVTFSGLTTSAPFDQESGTTATPVTTIQPGALTPSAANSLIVTSLTHASSLLVSIGGSATFTMAGSIALSAGTNYANDVAYLIQTTAASVNPLWTVDSADQLAAEMAVFK